MRITLFRHGSIEEVGTFSNLHVGNFVFPAIEREWMNNERRISCIPNGEYRLVPYSSPKYPRAYALVNESLGVYKHEADVNKDINKTRYAILIHSANLPSQLAGCIAIGMTRGYPIIAGKLGLGVVTSKRAVKKLFDLLDSVKEEHIIEVTNVPISW